MIALKILVGARPVIVAQKKLVVVKPFMFEVKNNKCIEWALGTEHIRIGDRSQRDGGSHITKRFPWIITRKSLRKR